MRKQRPSSEQKDETMNNEYGRELKTTRRSHRQHCGFLNMSVSKSQCTLKRLKGICFWIRKLRTLSWSTRSKYMSFPICSWRSTSRATYQHKSIVSGTNCSETTMVCNKLPKQKIEIQNSYLWVLMVYILILVNY